MISTFKIKKYLTFFILILIIVLPISVSAQTKNLVNIYFFHSKDCSHCNSEIKLLDDLEKKYDNVNIYRYEVHNQENNQNRLKILELYNLKSNGVPLTIIGDTPYLGYNETTSNLKFIKTIEYYSRYGYKDSVGELLQIESLPTYQIDNNNPTLDNFLETYGNYQLIGTLYTNDLDLSSIATILGILSQFNIIKIITLIIIILLVTIKEPKKGLIYILFYLTLSYLLSTINVLTNHIYIITLVMLSFISFILGLIFVFNTKHQKYLYIFIVIISLITNSIENIIFSNQLIVFKELLNLYNLTSLNKISYYGNYLSTALIINIIYILFYIFINNKISKQKISE